MADLPVLQESSRGTYVTWLQLNMNGLALNYNEFPTNGIFDQKTSDALKNFQDRFTIDPSGSTNAVTWKVLNNNVMAVQKLLKSRGLYDGAIDGWYGSKTEDAVRRFQSESGLYPTQIVDPRTRQKLFNPHPKEHFETRPTSIDLSSLNPRVAAMARNFLELTRKHNLDVRIITAFRSWEEEDKLYAQGRWTPGQIVTNARGGDSYHNWGLAFDAAPYEHGKMSMDVAKFKQMGALGEQAGLKWGGTFRAIVDYPHFQYTFGLNTWDLLNGVRPPA